MADQIIGRCVKVAKLHFANDGFYENVMLSSPEGAPEFKGYWNNGKQVPMVIGTAMWMLPVLALAAFEGWDDAIDMLNTLEPRLNFMRPGGQYDYLWHQGYYAVDDFLRAGD